MAPSQSLSIFHGIHRGQRRRYARVQLGREAADAVSGGWDGGAGGARRYGRISGGARILRRLRLVGTQAGTLSSGRLGDGGAADAGDAGIAKQKRRENSMQPLKDLEIGVMFWGGGDPAGGLPVLQGAGGLFRPNRRSG